MVTVTYVSYDGTEHVVKVFPGMSAMEGAVKNGVPGVDADCGGACACATCHVHVDAAWLSAVGNPGDMESAMLEFAYGRRKDSRLSCQITVSEDLDGLILNLPKRQS